MASNLLPLVIPCHRVIGARGKLGGFSAHGALGTKLRLLTIEGADLTAVTRWGVRQLKRADPKLGAVIQRVGPYRLLERQLNDHFATLVLSIVHQQVSMKAGASIFDRVSRTVTKHGARPLDAVAILDTSTDALRGAGLSRQKVSYLRDLATRTSTKALDLSRLDYQDDEVIIRSLSQVRGVGRWTAEMFLIFRLGRLNVLPTDDLGLRKAAQQLYGLRRLPDRAALERIAEPWVPFRSVATWYLWRSLDGGGL
jgi:3-methyladenine DNA glycosylase/8-oxoguanine DNA glycosylase